MTNIKEIEKFLENQNNEISIIRKKANLASWNANIFGKKEDYDEYEKLQMELETFLNNKEDFEKIKRFLKKENISQLIKRQLKILYNSYLSSQGDINLIKKIIKKSTEIGKKFNIYRAKINNKEFTGNEIKEILKTETNSLKLKEAWEASKKVGEIIEKELIELIKLRNKLAKSLGFENYYSLSLEAGEQKEEEIKSIFDELANLTEEPFKKIKKEIDSFLSKKYDISMKELKPWHYQDLFFQEGPIITKIDLDNLYSKNVLINAKKFYNSIGLPVEDILERSDLYEKPGKYPHACCMDIDRRGDVRIIQNMKDNEKWMEITLHELGHGVYQKFMDKINLEDLPFVLRWPAHMFTTEAIALLFGRLSKNTPFIKEYCDVENNKIDEMEKDLFKALKIRQLVFARWSQVMFNFERELYKNPEQNLNKLWWNLVKKYQMINFIRDKPDWASKIHLSIYPVYYHNYLLGELLASQINNYIGKNILKIDVLNNLSYLDNEKIGEYLKENIFSKGRKDEWNEMIKMATGENLNPKYFVEQFVEKDSK